MPFLRRRTATTLTAGLLLALGTACSSDVGNTTCSEFAQMSESKQDTVLKKLLDSHDKESGIILGMSNRELLRSQLEEFCGINRFYGDSQAHENTDQPIDNGANWT
jgi:hypothetical protein